MSDRWLKSILAAVLLFLPSLGLAHTHLKSSEPQADAVLAKAPGKVQLRLSEAVEPKLSRVRVSSETGGKVELGAPQALVGDPTGFEVTLKGAMAPGKYKVEWSTVSKDTHKAKGSFHFTVTAGKGAQ